jgi:hypothetical protein
MVIKSFSDTVLLQEKRDVLRVHLYFKFIQFGIKPFENDIDIIIELYIFGGYTNSDQQNRFIELCIAKGLKKSPQSVRNTLSKYVNMGIFEKSKNTHLKLNDNYIPKVEADKIVLQHKISHAK